MSRSQDRTRGKVAREARTSGQRTAEGAAGTKAAGRATQPNPATEGAADGKVIIKIAQRPQAWTSHREGQGPPSEDARGEVEVEEARRRGATAGSRPEKETEQRADQGRPEPRQIKEVSLRPVFGQGNRTC